MFQVVKFGCIVGYVVVSGNFGCEQYVGVGDGWGELVCNVFGEYGWCKGMIGFVFFDFQVQVIMYVWLFWVGKN